MQTTHVQHVKSQNNETSEGHNTRSMQYNAQMIKPAMERPNACQNSGHNVLRWLHGKQEYHVHALAHK